MRARHRRRIVIGVVSFGCLACAVYACTGDDPAPQTAPDDAGTGADSPGVDSSSTDGGRDASDSGLDAGLDAGPACKLAQPFQKKGKLLGIDPTNATSEFGATLSADELSIYFASNQDNLGTYQRIYKATRAKRSDPFANVAPVVGVNASNQDPPDATTEFPSLTADGKTLYFSSSSVSGDPRPYRIWRSTLAGGLFPTGVKVADVNSTGVDKTPYILPSAGALYFTSNRNLPTRGIYRAKAASSGGFDAPVFADRMHVPDGGNGGGLESFPVVSDDEAFLFWGAQYPFGQGDFDIWTRVDGGGLDDAGLAGVDELNTAAAEWPAWLSIDRCRLYYIYADPDTGGNLDLFWAERPPP